ncbi:Glycosyltransferase involved in cell wall bisynthesis [Paucidesulfovibrio gracilis DSM 16080]|uniref:Glycosyltransferase involved in cell wall bisynthesis n=2 Tax=Paucidesulfovibrio TaxID=2910985 RepID=A0A1T4W2N7_9BACT|nr:Glycosyltransferase involved in cell wall bisynthesis [Paucidesulfovibrio gracilis DSM 16080]
MPTDGINPLVLHDYFETPDGGGRTALLAARALGADLCHGARRSDHPYWPSYAPPGQEHALGRTLSINLVRQWEIQRRFLHISGRLLQGRPVALYSGSYAPLAVLAHRACRNICYCHTPPRFLYDQRKQFLSAVVAPMRPIYQMALRRYQRRYERAMRSMDLIVTNSCNVQERIGEYLGLQSRVLYPPCEVDQYRWAASKGYFLSAARHDALKRVGVILDAFALIPDKQLVVISDGPESPALEARAAKMPNVRFLGRVTESTYRRVLGECTGGIYIPKDEDFGLTPVESMAAGKPVVGVAQGGLLETVVPGKTGILLPSNEVTAQRLAAAVGALDSWDAEQTKEACRAVAEKFSFSMFRDALCRIAGTDAKP